jgi:hypothetical protein
MPIEVRELVITATVTQEVAPGSTNGQSSSSSNTNPTAEMINICVEKVLEILKDKHER